MVTITPPTERVCERCGRKDEWDETKQTFVAQSSQHGNPHCLHEWDINGKYNPLGKSQS